MLYPAKVSHQNAIIRVTRANEVGDTTHCWLNRMHAIFSGME